MVFINRMLSLAKEQLKRIPTLTLSLLKKLPGFAWHVTKQIPGFIWRQIKATPQRIVNSLKFSLLLMAVIYMFGGMIAALVLLTPAPGVSSLQVVPNLPPLQESDKFSSQKSIVRIFGNDGEFTCTGFVVSKNYVITAGHCISNDDVLDKKPITIENLATGERVIAKPVGINTRMDWGLIYGDFSDMPAAKIAYNYHMVPSEAVACGYPQGTRTLHCENLRPSGNNYFYVQAGGALFPGMSGGPVFNQNGVVIGINSAVTSRGVVYAPTVGIFAGFGIADY